MSAINWFENPEFDAPELKSPQPCIHGAGCVFTVKNAEGVISPGCCRYVHPGEEGTGRRLFPERQLKETGAEASFRVQPACVRLTGNAGYYERRRLRLPWSEWCALKGIPYKRNEPGVRHEPVKRIPVGAKKAEPINVMAVADSWPSLPTRIATIKAEQDLEWGGEDPDYICTFCGHKELDCGGDHGDEMRDIQREALERY
jgi:hypothetical protein